MDKCGCGAVAQLPLVAVAVVFQNGHQQTPKSHTKVKSFLFREYLLNDLNQDMPESS